MAMFPHTALRFGSFTSSIWKPRDVSTHRAVLSFLYGSRGFVELVIQIFTGKILYHEEGKEHKLWSLDPCLATKTHLVLKPVSLSLRDSVSSSGDWG